MTTPLQSPEYAALVAAKEARDAAYAVLEARTKDFLATSPMTLDGGDYARSQIYKAGQAYELARFDVTLAEAKLETAQAAFDAAYPAPADVMAAVDAVKAAQSALLDADYAFNNSLTPAQNALQDTMTDAKAALDTAVTHAKALIEAAQVSPSKAFVVRKSVKTDVTVEADRVYIFERALTGELSQTLLTIDEAALVKWIEDNPDTALDYGASVTRTDTVKVSAAFYAAKL